MNKVFVVKNQHGLYLSKQQEWGSGADGQTLFRTPHRDEAINTVFEVSSRDIYLRAEAVACDVDAKNNPVVAVEASQNTSSQADLLIDADNEAAVETEEAASPADAAADAPVDNSAVDAAPPQAEEIETPLESPHLRED